MMRDRSTTIALAGIPAVLALIAITLLLSPNSQQDAARKAAKDLAQSQYRRAEYAPPTTAAPLDRPFSVFPLALGEIPLALPMDWVEPELNVPNTGPTKWMKTTLVKIYSGRDTATKNTQVKIYSSLDTWIVITNAHQRLSPRSKHFEIPALEHFVALHIPIGIAEQNLNSQRTKLHERWADRQPDDDGFWHWQTREDLFVGQPYQRPLDQPLIVSCSPSVRPNQKGEQRCTVRFYWTPNVSVRYDFYDTDYPKSRWVELDQRVLAMLDFIDGRKAWP